MEGIDSVLQPGEESEEIKTRRAPSSPREAWGKTGGLSCSSKPGQALAACVPASGMATGQNHQHAHLRLPGTARDCVPEPAPAGPAPLSPPPLSARSRAQAWICFPASQLRHVPLPHTRRPSPSASPGKEGPGAPGRGMRSARFLTSGWRRGTQPASVSYSSGPSAILVLNPSSRCMPGESVSPSQGSGEAEGEREGKREPRGRRRDRLLLLPLPPGYPLSPLSSEGAGPCARALAPGRPRARARSAALRRGKLAEGFGRGRSCSGAGPGSPAPGRCAPLVARGRRPGGD